MIVHIFYGVEGDVFVFAVFTQELKILLADESVGGDVCLLPIEPNTSNFLGLPCHLSGFQYFSDVKLGECQLAEKEEWPDDENGQ